MDAKLCMDYKHAPAQEIVCRDKTGRLYSTIEKIFTVLYNLITYLQNVVPHYLTISFCTSIIYSKFIQSQPCSKMLTHFH